MVSRWRDRETFKAYVQSADHRISHARMSPTLKAAISLERLEHMHTYDMVAS